MTTVLEHNSVLRPLYRLEQQGVEFSAAGCDELGNVSAQDIESLFQKNTRAVVCTHASNLTGNLTDIREIGRLAHERGILMIVDGAQTAGVFLLILSKTMWTSFVLQGIKVCLDPREPEAWQCGRDFS